MIGFNPREHKVKKEETKEIEKTMLGKLTLN